jgi:hypothetical protein
MLLDLQRETKISVIKNFANAHLHKTSRHQNSLLINAVLLFNIYNSISSYLCGTSSYLAFKILFLFGYLITLPIKFV